MKEFIVSHISRCIPESDLKNRLSCIYKNCCEKNNYSIAYKNKIYIVVFDSIPIMLCTNKCEEAFNQGYLEHYRIKKNDFVVDGGAYVGAFSIYAAKIVGDGGKVIAFEPDAKNYKLLLKNIKLNKSKNIIPINKGLWRNSTTLRFRSSSGEASSLIFDENQNGHINQDGNIIDVEVTSLDDELELLNIKKVDFIKMDIEGAEVEAVKGAKRLLKNNYVNLAIASYHIVDGKQTYLELTEVLTGLGYHSETGFLRHLTTYAKPLK
jgi:FkbM family methyltransferase